MKLMRLKNEIVEQFFLPIRQTTCNHRKKSKG